MCGRQEENGISGNGKLLNGEAGACQIAFHN